MASVDHDKLGKMNLTLMGEGQVSSRGIRRGVVVNVAEVTAAISEAVEKCEKAAGEPLLRAYVGIAGSHIGTRNSTGVSPVDKRQGVTNSDMYRALEGAAAVSLPQNTEVIHTIARQWKVDGQDDVQQPLGMSGIRLEVDAHIVTGSSTAVNNLVQCVTAHEIEIDELVLEPLASNEAVLKADERRMGVAVIDIGGGTTDLAIFRDNCLSHTQILDMGGNHLTNDLAVGLRCPFETAEELKLRYGHVLPDRVADDEKVWATVFGEKTERSFSRRFIAEVLEARALEMFDLLREKLEESGQWDRLPAGVVLTGGASQLHGLAELGRSVLNLPVRIGAPNGQLPISGLSRNLQQPIYATSVGLLLWGMKEDNQAIHRRFEAEPTPKPSEWRNRTMNWLKHLLPG